LFETANAAGPRQQQTTDAKGLNYIVEEPLLLLLFHYNKEKFQKIASNLLLRQCIAHDSFTR